MVVVAAAVAVQPSVRLRMDGWVPLALADQEPHDHPDVADNAQDCLVRLLAAYSVDWASAVHTDMVDTSDTDDRAFVVVDVVVDVAVDDLAQAVVHVAAVDVPTAVHRMASVALMDCNIHMQSDRVEVDVLRR